MSDSKGPDRTYVSKEGWEIITNIDNNKFCNLHSPETSRSELYLYAMSLGFDTSCRKPLSSVHQGGLSLEKSIDPRSKALMIALSIYDAESDEFESLENAINKAHVFTLSDEYANAGLFLLKDEMDSTKADEDYLWKTLKDIDRMYKDYFPED